MCHEDENNYLPRFAVFIDHAGELKGLMGLDDCCSDCPYDRYYLSREADAWSRQLDL